jgi:hypothetical protein
MGPGSGDEVMNRERRYDIDWLRSIAMLAVFFHCTRFFDTEGWHVKNAEQSDLLFITAIWFPLTLALYELLVRRFNVVRFPFGMRSRERLQAT